jgi:hypothetical protein
MNILYVGVLLFLSFYVQCSYNPVLVNDPNLQRPSVADSRAAKKLQQALEQDAQLLRANKNYAVPIPDITSRPATQDEIADLITSAHLKKLEQEATTALGKKGSNVSKKLNFAKDVDALLYNQFGSDSSSERFEKPTALFRFSNRDEWTRACSVLFKNISIMAGMPQQSAFLQHRDIQNKTGAWNEFELALNQVFDKFRQGELSDPSAWTSKGTPSKKFYDIRTNNGQNIVDVFEPYVQKLALYPGDKIMFHGDLHGDIHSLMHWLTWLDNRGYLEEGSFKLAHPNTYLVFLGDYVDRGYYGAEVIYTLLRLKIANPDQVILVRGNHEDTSFHMHGAYSFKDELGFKFRPDKDVEKLIARLYNFLPVALYVGYGNDYLQCCHGGIEHGYKPANLLNEQVKFDLLGELSRFDCLAADDYKIGYMMSEVQKDGTFLWLDPELAINFTPEGLKYAWRKNEQGKTESRTLGFAWFDFAKFGPSFWNVGRGLVTDKDLTQAILDYQNKNSKKKVRGVFRAHQHSPVTERGNPTNLMSELIASEGVYKLWQPIETGRVRSLQNGLVWTFNVAPDSLYGMGNNYKLDAFAMLRIAEQYKDWQLSVYNISALMQVRSSTNNSPQTSI